MTERKASPILSDEPYLLLLCCEDFMFHCFSKSLLLWLSASLLLSSCTFKKMVYDRLDTVALYQINTYLDLEDAQEDRIKPPLKELVAWVKSEKVPEAIGLLSELEQAAQAKRFDRAMLDRVYQQLDRWREDISQKALDPTSDLLVTLDAAQIAHLQKKMRKGIEPLEELLVEDPEDFDGELEDYIDDQVKKYKPWYGALRPDQVETLVKSLVLTREGLSDQLALRQKSRATFLELIEKKDRQQLVQYMKSWLAGDGAWADAAHREKLVAARQRWDGFWLQFHSSLDAAQWQQLQKKLAETRRDLEELSARPTPS